MTRILSAVLLLLPLLLALSNAPSQRVAYAQSVPSKEAKAQLAKEKPAREKAAKAADAYATWCGRTGAYSKARDYVIAASLLRRTDIVAREYAKYAGKEDAPTAAHEKEHESQRRKLLDAGAVLLDYCTSARAKDVDYVAHETAMLWLSLFRDDALLEKAEWGWSKRMWTLAPKADIERMEGGEIRHAGSWLNAEEIGKLDAAHGSLDKPLVLDDTFSVVKSEIGLERTLRLYSLLTLFRIRLWLTFGGDMDWKRPRGLLEFFVARDLESMDRLGRKICQNQGTVWRSSGFSGTYFGQLGATLCPAGVCPEGSLDASTRAGLPELTFHNLVQHELTHQLCNECLKHRESRAVTSSPTPPPQPCYWVVEGVATWMETLFWSHESLSFEPKLVRQLPLEGNTGKAMEAHLARAQRLGESMKRVDQLAVQTKEEFWSGGLQAYSEATALTLFLVNRSAESRSRFVRLAISIHTIESTRESFKQAFKGEDLSKLNQEMQAWLKAVTFED